MQGRRERTIRQSVETSGIGFLTGRDVTLRFLPAASRSRHRFRRTDCPGTPADPGPDRIHRPRSAARPSSATARRSK